MFINATLQVKDVSDLILQEVLDDDDVREQMTRMVMRSLCEQYNDGGTSEAWCL